MNAILNILMSLSCVLLTHLVNCSPGKQVSMKIVQEPTSYGFNAGGRQHQPETTPSLKMRLTPANFSGPPHLRRMLGHCFTSVIESYKYQFCPFSNITQHEQSLRWNPYSGVLGVWQEWEIVNNTFVAMVMSEGDSCGKVHRSTKILLRCGERSGIQSVSEPRTCEYEMVFHSPLVCHSHSLLVYPTLPRLLQREWDVLEGRVLADDITHKGYKKLLQKLFEKAGYRVATEAKHKLSEMAKQREARDEQTHAESFDTLYQCQAEYNKLKEEVASLRTILRVNNIQDDLTERAHANDRDIGDIPPDYNHLDMEWMHGQQDY